MVKFIYPITLYARKVQFKEDYVFAVQTNGEKHRIPYKDVVQLERIDSKQIRLTYQRRGDWSVIVGRTPPVRINKYIVRYDRKGMEPVYVKQKETE